MLDYRKDNIEKFSHGRSLYHVDTSYDSPGQRYNSSDTSARTYGQMDNTIC